MKANNLLFTIFSLLFIVSISAQCPTCVVDETIHTSTGPEDLGLIPDNVTIQAGFISG
jgi:hypothetical protein